MLARNDQAPVLHAWHSDLNDSIEAGIAPTIPLGMSDAALTALPSLSLLRDLAAQRTDMSVPTALAGGGSGAWLMALFINAESADGQPPATADGASAERVSPPPVLSYAGADAATYMASAGILPRAPVGLQPVTDRGLPAGVRDAVAPALQPAAPVAWENVPFRLLETAGGATGLPAASPLMGWLAGILVIAMILGALIM